MEINLTYLENIKQIKETFNEKGSVILNQFFDDINLEFNWKKDVEILHHSYETSKVKVNSKKLSGFLSKILNKKIKLNFTAYKFSWKDYQILNDKYLEEPGVDIIIDITDWDPKMGGLITYADGSGDYTELPVSKNSLILFKRNKGINRFVQYVNHYGKERIFLIEKTGEKD